jgi:hypothetical protein
MSQRTAGSKWSAHLQTKPIRLLQSREKLHGEQLMRIAGLIGAAICCVLLIATQSAYACPEGTSFSAYKGNGICAYDGQGAKVAVQCTLMVNSCPHGTTHEHKHSDEAHDYCCSTKITNEQSKTCVWRGEAPACDGYCGSLEQYRGAAHNQAEADHKKSTKAWGGSFGASCFSGAKVLCCHYNG